MPRTTRLAGALVGAAIVVLALVPATPSYSAVTIDTVTVSTTTAPLPDPTVEPASHETPAKVPADGRWLWLVPTLVALLATAIGVPVWVARRRV